MFIKNLKYEILTDDGFSDFDGIQCVIRNVYISIIFESGNNIKVSTNHKFFDKNYNEILTTDLKVGYFIKGLLNGIEKITEINTIECDNTKLYDPINVSKNRRYISNGVLSHNCEFLGSSSTVIDSDTLKTLQDAYKDPLLYDLEDYLRVYEKPEPGARYCMGVDVAKGTGRHYSTIQVLKILSTNPLKLEQVCTYQNNFIDVYKFSMVINKLSFYYNNAYIMCENNADGAAVVTQLWWEYENENLVNTGSKEADLGIRATKSTKPKAVLFMKKLIENFDLSLVDHRTIIELNDFVEKGNNKYGANNFDDDLVSALYWACYLFQMGIVDDVNFLEKENGEDDEAWGILTDINPEYDDDFGYVVL